MANQQSPKLVLRLAAWTARVLPAGAKRAIYRFGPLTRLVRSELNRAAPTGFSLVTVAAGELAGMQLNLDLQTEKDYWLGTYEAALQTALHELVKPGSVAYDVGANIGYISLILSSLVQGSGQVFAFEALPENLSRLQENLSLSHVFGGIVSFDHAGQMDSAGEVKKNLGKGLVRVFPGAVVDRVGPVQFLVGPSGGMGKAEGSAGRQDVAYSEQLTVAGISLDNFVFVQEMPPPQVIKIDIEGGEVLALPGMQQLLSEYHPLAFLELHGPESALAAWTAFQAAGYLICRMQPGFPVINSLDELNWKAYLVARPRE